MKEKFNTMFAVVKDLGSIRAKGIWMEDIIDYLDNHFTDSKVVESKAHYPSGGIYFTEAIRTIGKYGMYTFMGNAGLPTLCIGSKTQEDWIELRTKLQEAGLVRVAKTKK